VCKKTNIQKSHAHFEAQRAKNKQSKKPCTLGSTVRKKQMLKNATHTLKHTAQKNKYSEKPRTL